MNIVAVCVKQVYDTIQKNRRDKEKSWNNWTFFSSPSIILTAPDISKKLQAGSDLRTK